MAAQASTLLRKAAGVYQWLQDRGIPRAAAKIPASERCALERALGLLLARRRSRVVVGGRQSAASACRDVKEQ